MGGRTPRDSGGLRPHRPGLSEPGPGLRPGVRPGACPGKCGPTWCWCCGAVVLVVLVLLVPVLLNFHMVLVLRPAAGASRADQPCRCLWRRFSQMTMTRP